MAHLSFSKFSGRNWGIGLVIGWIAVSSFEIQIRAQDNQYDPDWARHFRVGALVGLNIKANFRTGGDFTLSGRHTQPGVYDDGYVREDQTGDALGLTSFWGYENASQYDAGNHSLMMHQTTSFSTATGGGRQTDEPYMGFDLAYGGNIWYAGRTRIGWEMGFGLLPINISQGESGDATVHRSVFSFDTGNIVVPTAPYHGGSSGVGPTIHDTPAQLSDEDLAGTINGSETLDVTLYVLRLGPSFYWDLNRRVGVSLGAGPAVGFVSGALTFNETITAGGSNSRNKGSIGASEIVYGGYVSGALMYHAVKNGDFYIGAQFMPMGNATVRGGGRQARLDLGGALFLSAGINWPF